MIVRLVPRVSSVKEDCAVHTLYYNYVRIMKDLTVVVVGAGIGGLQTALALANDGHHVTVLESAKAFEEVRCCFFDPTALLTRTFEGRSRDPHSTKLAQAQQLLGRRLRQSL